MGKYTVLPESLPVISNDNDQRRTKQIASIKEINEVLDNRIRLSDAEDIALLALSLLRPECPHALVWVKAGAVREMRLVGPHQRKKRLFWRLLDPFFHRSGSTAVRRGKPVPLKNS